MTQGRGRLRILTVNILVVLASCGFSLLILEAAVRVFYRPVETHVTTFRLKTSSYYQPDDVLGWRPRKDITGVQKAPGNPDTIFHTNSRGLRGREHSLEKRPGQVRLVVLGDSFAWGFGVNDGEIFTDVLETLLPNTEVINLGVTAYATRQEVQYFRDEGVIYSPDIVVLAFCLNDIYETTPAIEPGGALRASPLKQLLAQYSYLYQFTRDRINTNKSLVRALVKVGLKEGLAGFEELDPNLMLALKQYPIKLQRALEQVQSEILALRRLVEARHARLVVALLPSHESVNRTMFLQSIAYTVFDETDFDLERAYRVMVEFCERENIEVINPYPVFIREQKTATKSLYLVNDVHFSPEGHALFAKQIAEYLLQRGKRIATDERAYADPRSASAIRPPRK